MKRYSLFALMVILSIVTFCGGLYSGAYIAFISQKLADSAIRETLLNALTRIIRVEQLNAGEVEQVSRDLRRELDAHILMLRMFMEEGAKMDNETSEAIRVVLAREAKLGDGGLSGTGVSLLTPTNATCCGPH